ncbi:MAG: PfkB family carbohydrate kinase [Thermomicrobiales bacterium]|nr:PfkB family carbohydrate kinase [Thermomicrobiales bacterium]
MPVCFDVNMRPAIWRDRTTARAACAPILDAATLLKLSLDDARSLLDLPDEPEADDVFRALAGVPANSIVLTDGARGSWYSNRIAGVFSAPVFVPSFRIEAVEPTGAGDAFLAAIIARLIDRSWEPLELDDVRYASAAGALTTTRAGAIDSLPSKSEIDVFLHEHTD